MVRKEEVLPKIVEQKNKIINMHLSLIQNLNVLKEYVKQNKMILYRKSNPDLGVLFTSEQIQQQYDDIINILTQEHKELSDRLAKIIDDEPSSGEQIKSAIEATLGFRYRAGHKQSKYPNLARTFCVYLGTDKEYKIAVTFGGKNNFGKKDKYNGKISGSSKKVRTGTSIIFSSHKFEHVAKISLNKEYIDMFDREAKIFEKVPTELCPFRFSAKPGTFFSLDHKVGKEITFFTTAAKNDLFDEISIKNMTEERRVYVFAKLLNDLNILHKRNIAHRDIKLENIFIGYDEQPYYGDFGLAGKEKSIMGTLEHASPRLLKNYELSQENKKYLPYVTFLKNSIDQNEHAHFAQNPHNPYADDIWALGITYYMCKAAKNPNDDMDSFKASIKDDIFLSAVLSINESQRSNALDALLILTARYIAQHAGDNFELETFLMNSFGGYDKFIHSLTKQIERLTNLSECNEIDMRKVETYQSALNKLNANTLQSNSKKIR